MASTSGRSRPRSPAARVAVAVGPALGVDIDVALLERALRTALAAEGRAAGYAVDLRVTDGEGIRALNRAHRGVDAPTDVLSFPLQPHVAGQPSSATFVLPPGEPVHLGDIVLSWPLAVAQAAEYGHSVEREAAYLVVHGVLHLLGYDHETAADAAVMRPREEAILAAVGLPR